MSDDGRVARQGAQDRDRAEQDRQLKQLIQLVTVAGQAPQALPMFQGQVPASQYQAAQGYGGYALSQLARTKEYEDQQRFMERQKFRLGEEESRAGMLTDEARRAEIEARTGQIGQPKPYSPLELARLKQGLLDKSATLPEAEKMYQWLAIPGGGQMQIGPSGTEPLPPGGFPAVLNPPVTPQFPFLPEQAATRMPQGAVVPSIPDIPTIAGIKAGQGQQKITQSGMKMIGDAIGSGVWNTLPPEQKLQYASAAGLSPEDAENWARVSIGLTPSQKGILERLVLAYKNYGLAERKFTEQRSQFQQRIALEAKRTAATIARANRASAGPKLNPTSIASALTGVQGRIAGIRQILTDPFQSAMMSKNDRMAYEAQVGQLEDQRGLLMSMQQSALGQYGISPPGMTVNIGGLAPAPVTMPPGGQGPATVQVPFPPGVRSGIDKETWEAVQALPQSKSNDGRIVSELIQRGETPRNASAKVAWMRRLQRSGRK